MFCAEQAVQLHRHAAEFRAAGAPLVLIGNGAPGFIAGFRDRTGFAGAVYTDPGRTLYHAMRLRRSVRSSLSPRTALRAIAAYRDGFRQTRPQGDVWQQGGVFVIDADGQVQYAYRSRHAGDHPEIADIRRALVSPRAASAV